jgi:hypothetical protein
MLHIINWCSGGIGNRLRPLATCSAISKLTGRRLGYCWQPTLRCMTNFTDLFAQEAVWTDLSLEQVASLNDVSIYSEVYYIEHDARLNGCNVLLDLYKRFGCKPLCAAANIRTDPAENIIVYDNNFFGDFDRNDSVSFIKNLKPIDSIQNKIDSFLNTNKLDKSWIGVHARGTDFENSGISVHTYMNQMEAYRGSNFFLCSDSKQYEDTIKASFPNVLTFDKNSYVYKNSPHGSWVNNVNTPKESVQDSLVDLYLLGKTDIKVFNSNSTFAEISALL